MNAKERLKEFPVLCSVACFSWSGFDSTFVVDQIVKKWEEEKKPAEKRELMHFLQTIYYYHYFFSVFSYLCDFVRLQSNQTNSQTTNPIQKCNKYVQYVNAWQKW